MGHIRILCPVCHRCHLACNLGEGEEATVGHESVCDKCAEAGWYLRGPRLLKGERLGPLTSQKERTIINET